MRLQAQPAKIKAAKAQPSPNKAHHFNFNKDKTAHCFCSHEVAGAACKDKGGEGTAFAEQSTSF
jgi:hypothetical protein